MQASLPARVKTTSLYVKKSGLPGAGKGLFTRVPIAKGNMVVEYKGKISTWKKVQENDTFNGYIFYVSRNHVVDALPVKKAYGRYANDAKGLTKVPGIRNNSTYVVQQKRVFIKALKDIPAGGEILVDYGREYWTAVRYNKRLEAAEKKK